MCKVTPTGTQVDEAVILRGLNSLLIDYPAKNLTNKTCLATSNVVLFMKNYLSKPNQVLCPPQKFTLNHLAKYYCVGTYLENIPRNHGGFLQHRYGNAMVV